MKLDKSLLELMYDELKTAPKIYYPSNFWDNLGKEHFNQLTNNGIRNFKRSINLRYFNWGILGILRHQLAPIISEINNGNITSLLKSKINRNKFNRLGGIIYRVYVASLYEYVLKIDKLEILKKLEEPSLGNPLIVYYKNKKISQDLCNSVLEFYSIVNRANLKQNIKIAELGAGYGRVAYVFLKTFPNCSYYIIDIPPALYVAQEYMSKLFEKDKIFKFRHFNNFKQVAKEIKSAKIIFLTPNQMELLPPKIFDLIINISSLHEMQSDQIRNYIKQIDRLDKGFFYTKQWRKSRVRDNKNITEDKYPIPKKWKKIFKHTHPIQKMFFEALYEV